MLRLSQPCVKLSLKGMSTASSVPWDSTLTEGPEIKKLNCIYSNSQLQDYMTSGEGCKCLALLNIIPFEGSFEGMSP